jgi:hypothetical protein
MLGFPGMLFGFFLMTLLAFDPEDMSGSIVDSSMFLGGGLFAFWAFLWVIDEVYEGYWKHDVVKGTPGGVHVPRMGPVWFFLRTKAIVPYTDVRRVRKRLSPGTEAHYYEALATGDRVFKIHRGLYDTIIARDEFEPSGFEHVNRSPVPVGEPPLVSTRAGLYGLYILTATMAWAVLLLLLFNIMEYVEAAERAVAPVCISVLIAIVIVMVFGILLPNARTSRRLKAMRGRDMEFHVDPTGMRIPGAPPALREVSRYDVESVTVRRFPGSDSTKYLDLRTSRGRLDLPVSLADDISGAGYVVEDPEGHLTDQGEGGEEEGRTGWRWRHHAK